MDNGSASESRLAGILGIARRAGRLACGYEAAVGEMKRGRACLVIVAADASKRTAQSIGNQCEKYNVPCVNLPICSDSLGYSIGRSKVAVVALTDKSFSFKVKEILDAGK